jgi:hypothetical protein
MNKHKEVLGRDLKLALDWKRDCSRCAESYMKDGDINESSIYQFQANDAQERAEAIQYALDAMAKAETFEKQVEFLEWIVWIEREFGITHVNRSGVVSVKKADGWPVISWPGQLRDGWKHWDKIKEAVK